MKNYIRWSQRIIFIPVVILLIAAASYPSQSSLSDRTIKDQTIGNVWYVSVNGDDLTGSGTTNSPFLTIQRAIDTAANGDQVVVFEGTYTGPGNINIDFKGKAITVRSRNPEDDKCISSTIIDAQGQGVIARFVHDEGHDSVLRGFTLLPGDRSAPIRGNPGFFEFSKYARPTTEMLRVTDDKQNLSPIEIPALSAEVTGTRIWNGNDPFSQPAVTTDYYGSGDVNNDGTLAAEDISLAQDMADGNSASSFRADVNGDGRIDQTDVSLISNAIHTGTILPGWWNRLSTSAQRNTWVDRFLAFDRTDEHLFTYWHLCISFSIQLFLHGAIYRGDLNTTEYGGGQRGFNIPLYVAQLGSGHFINAILVGDDPLNFHDWRFIEPQTDEDVQPGMWDMPYGDTVSILVIDYIFYTSFETNKPLVTFGVDISGETLISYDSNLILSRPTLITLPPDNRLDYWRPTILPSTPGTIIFEQQQDNLSYTNDIYVANLPFNDQTASTPLNLAQVEYSRILDAFLDSYGTVHLLWTGKPDYKPGVFYSQMDLTSRMVSNTTRIDGERNPLMGRVFVTRHVREDCPPQTEGERNPLMGRVFVTPQGEIHILWFEQKHLYKYNTGIYWTRWTGSGWQEPQNLTPNVPGGGRLWSRLYEHEPITYIFDAAISNNGEIVVAYTAYLSADIHNENPVNIIRYNNGQWGTANIVGNPAIKAYGLDLSFDGNDDLHLFYWDRELNVDTKGPRGDLYDIMFDGVSWSAPFLIDQSGLAGYPRSARDTSGRIYLVWERKIENQVVPVWNQFYEGEWEIPQLLSVSPNADAWYPDVTAMPDGHIVFSWSSRSPDRVTIETTFILSQSFVDVSPDYWAASWIERLYHAGITAGCGTNPLMYCPESPVTRAEMAIFLERGIHGSAYNPPAGTGLVFNDVPPGYWALDWIEKLYADAITSGCGTSPLVYCPESPVTRAEMAVFLLKAKHGAAYNPPVVVGIFADVPTTYWAASWIEQLYAEGITGGCSLSPLSYCPERAVTRAEMAVFLVRTFNLP